MPNQCVTPHFVPSIAGNFIYVCDFGATHGTLDNWNELEQCITKKHYVISNRNGRSYCTGVRHNGRILMINRF